MTENGKSSFVYVTYIRTTPEKLWQALITPEFAAAALESLVAARFDVPLVLTQPDTAANIVKSIAAILETAATNITSFFTQRLSRTLEHPSSDHPQTPTRRVPSQCW